MSPHYTCIRDNRDKFHDRVKKVRAPLIYPAPNPIRNSRLSGLCSPHRPFRPRFPKADRARVRLEREIKSVPAPYGPNFAPVSGTRVPARSQIKDEACDIRCNRIISRHASFRIYPQHLIDQTLKILLTSAPLHIAGCNGDFAIRAKRENAPRYGYRLKGFCLKEYRPCLRTVYVFHPHHLIHGSVVKPDVGFHGVARVPVPVC